jgi:hypothetical protein
MYTLRSLVLTYSCKIEEEIERMNEDESAGLRKTEEEGQHDINVYIDVGMERGQSAGRDRPPLLPRQLSPEKVKWLRDWRCWLGKDAGG